MILFVTFYFISLSVRLSFHVIQPTCIYKVCLSVYMWCNSKPLLQTLSKMNVFTGECTNGSIAWSILLNSSIPWIGFSVGFVLLVEVAWVWVYFWTEWISTAAFVWTESWPFCLSDFQIQSVLSFSVSVCVCVLSVLVNFRVMWHRPCIEVRR